MKIGVLGSGMVGQALAGRLAELGHDVVIGTRDAAKLADWQKSVIGQVAIGSFTETATHGELLIVATKGDATLDVLKAAGEENLNGKVLIDISNPLDFSKGMPPTLFIINDDSLGEQIQRTFPQAKVVKTLNTTSAPIMINPRQLADGDHHIFVSGNDADAKAQVSALLTSFGWRNVVDLGDITTARGTEQLLSLWIRLFGNLQTPMFNFKIVQ